MRRLAFLTATFALAAWMGIFVLGHGGRAIAMTDIRQALAGVITVHITGEEQAEGGTSGSDTLPLAVHKDKWLRSKPFAVYEEATPANPGSPVKRYTFAGNTELTYWYFPDQGNKAVVGKGLSTGFLDFILSVLQPSDSTGDLRVTGHVLIDGRELDLLESGSDDYTMELAVDPQTNRTYRVRQFKTGTDGKQMEITNLRIDYDQTPPANTFDWQPPQDARIVDKRAH